MIDFEYDRQASIIATRFKPMKKPLILLLICFLSFVGHSQEKRRVIFYGNSYTAGLPHMIEQIAFSAGDTLEAFESTAGGQRLKNHFESPQTKDEITNTDWDYVVFQEQSQLPSFPQSQVEADCYPYAKALCDIVHQDDACKKAMFYMTWGRKNGDQANCSFFPPLCTYMGMDSMLRLRYEHMANVNKAELSPVGAVWREVITTYPTMELYSPDESHPSQVGMYTSACCFYAALFQKDPMGITETLGLDSVEALNIRKAAKKIVFDSLMRWNIGKYDLKAGFSFVKNSRNEFEFSNESKNNTGQIWEFESTTDTSMNPTFSFTMDGKQNVKLTTFNSCDTLIIEKEIEIYGVGIADNGKSRITIYPNPTMGNLIVQLPNESKIKNVQFLGINGTVVYKEKIGEKETVIEFNINFLKTGIYFVEVETSEGVYRSRFVKE